VGQQTALLADLLGNGDLALAGDPHGSPVNARKNLAGVDGPCSCSED